MGELSIKVPLKENEEKVFTPYKIGEYTLNSPLTTTKSGFSKWGFCVKDDKEYFIKEFLNPVYPLGTIKIDEEIRKKKINQCADWYKEKCKIYRRIFDSQTGNLVVPNELFRDGSHFYLITDKVIESAMDCNEITGFDMEHKRILLKVLAHSFTKLAENNVVHADVKLDNLLIKKTNSDFFTVKVIDFDASYLVESPPGSEEIQGDMVYLAPESFLAMIDEPTRLTPKVDVFALGIIFHQILCGKLPTFDSEYDYVYEAVLNDADISLSNEIPEKYRILISNMLKKDIDERYSVNKVLEVLKDIENNKYTGEKASINQPNASETNNSRWRTADSFD